MEHGIRALAFHHEKGFFEQQRLARVFAGEGGRIATVEDILNARIHSSIKSPVWYSTFITDSKLYTGRSAAGTDLLVFAHGNGPEPESRNTIYGLTDSLSQFKGLDDWFITKQKFADLISGKYGEVHIVDLSTYKNPSCSNFASNRYKYEEALVDPIIQGFLGANGRQFLEHLHNEQQRWLADEPQEKREMAVIMCSRLYDIYQNFARETIALNSPGRVYPLTIEGASFYEWEGVRQSHGCDFGTSTNSGIDDLGGSAYYMVGIRGKEPVTSIEPCFRTLVPKVRNQWRHFVQPRAELPDDQYQGVKPSGSRENPYYLLSKWGSRPKCTARIKFDGSEATMPEYRIKNLRKIVAPPSVSFISEDNLFGHQYPYHGMWRAAIAAMPARANAISFGGSCHRGNLVEVSVDYWNVTLYEEPFQVLMKCGDSFFTQYCDDKRPSNQPYRLVSEAASLDSFVKLEIPEDVWEHCDSGRETWPLLSHLISLAPENSNALWLEKESVGYNEKQRRNIAHVTVQYYNATYGDMAFRSFAEIREDFDWQLQKRAEADLLIAT